MVDKARVCLSAPCCINRPLVGAACPHRLHMAMVEHTTACLSAASCITRLLVGAAWLQHMHMLLVTFCAMASQLWAQHLSKDPPNLKNGALCMVWLLNMGALGRSLLLRCSRGFSSGLLQASTPACDRMNGWLGLKDLVHLVNAAWLAPL